MLGLSAITVGFVRILNHERQRLQAHQDSIVL